MPDISTFLNSVTVPPATAAAAAAPSASSAAKPALGKDDFLKLLMAQIQNQDPMKPMDDTAFIAQTAQFSALQQATTLTQQMTQLRASQDLAAAGLVGQVLLPKPRHASAG